MGCSVSRPRHALNQAGRLGAEILVTRSVARIDPKTRQIFLDGDDVVRARALILATGVTWRHRAIEDFDRLIGNGIYYGGLVCAANSSRLMTASFTRATPTCNIPNCRAAFGERSMIARDRGGRRSLIRTTTLR